MHLYQRFCQSGNHFLTRPSKPPPQPSLLLLKIENACREGVSSGYGIDKKSNGPKSAQLGGWGCTSHRFIEDILQQHLWHAVSHYHGAASSLLHLNMAFSVWYDLAELSGHLYNKAQLLLCVQVWHADKPFHQYKKWDDYNFPWRRNHFCFLGVGDGDFHTELSCLLSGSKWCSQVSSAVITFERNSGSSCTIIFNCMQTSCCSGISSLGTHRTLARLMFYLSVANVWVVPSEIFKISESDLKVILQSSLTMTAVVLLFSSLRAVNSAPGPPSFEIDCLPSLNNVYHFELCCMEEQTLHRPPATLYKPQLKICGDESRISKQHIVSRASPPL